MYYVKLTVNVSVYCAMYDLSYYNHTNVGEKIFIIYISLLTYFADTGFLYMYFDVIVYTRNKYIYKNSLMNSLISLCLTQITLCYYLHIFADVLYGYRISINVF